MTPFHRILLIVLDGAGIGAMPDAPEWGDAGADTFGHILESRPVRLPNLQRYGLGNIRSLEALPPLDHLSGSYGRCALRSNGKDTTTGHWEMAGIILDQAFPTYPNGFPASVIDKFVKETAVPGILGNIPASGTSIMSYACSFMSGAWFFLIALKSTGMLSCFPVSGFIVFYLTC